MGARVTSFADALREQVRVRPDRAAFIFLENGETEADTLTYAELDRDARAIAALLQTRVAPGDRALLMYPPGLDFVRAFMGCLYAGVVAVPVYPPRRNRTVERLKAVAADARTAIALTNGTVSRALARGEGGDLDVPVLVADRETATNPGAYAPVATAASDLAFLQYTSGSTGTPKGVMITHGNLLHNCEVIRVAYSHTPESVFVSWLPVFHDMGLVGMVLEPIYTGSLAVLMEPAAFLQKPVRWLRAITRYGGTTSGAPNSAYELTARKVSLEDCASLDLRSWTFAYNGAEPVRAATLERFHETFAPCGLRLEAVQPCYGMAETTLLVSIAGAGRPPTIHTNEEGARFVSSGRSWLDQRVVIVNPETRELAAEGAEGEIW
ncbi:MAG: AMP-binding protein, partial [Acidobacteria bacterium]|nr:AMP-binding protein [Acidobacteriota bacterium]